MSSRTLRTFIVVVLCLYAGYLVRTIADEPHDWTGLILLGGIFAGSGLLLAWLARLAWTKIDIAAVRYVLTIALAYHALFGPVMLLHRILTPVTSNDDLGIVLWPHVVHWINSFE